MSKGRWLKLAVGCAATTGFAWLFAIELDVDSLGRAFAGLSALAIVLALACIAIGVAVRLVRWWWMLRALEPGLPVGACIRPFLASMAVNNVLPFRAGDMLRVVGFRRQLRSPATRTLGTLVIERALDVVVLSGFFFVCLLGLPNDALPRGIVVAAIWLASAGAAAILASMLLLPLFERFRWHLPGRRFLAARRWAGVVSRHGAHLIGALSLMRSLPRSLVLGVLSVAAWLCEGAAFAIVATALGADAKPLGPWLSLSAGSLATAIPSAPGYVGTFDYFAAQGLAAYGAAPETAAAFALTIHVLLWAPLTVVGLLLLLFHRSRQGYGSDE